MLFVIKKKVEFKANRSFKKNPTTTGKYILELNLKKKIHKTESKLNICTQGYRESNIVS